MFVPKIGGVLKDWVDMTPEEQNKIGPKKNTVLGDESEAKAFSNFSLLLSEVIQMGTYSALIGSSSRKFDHFDLSVSYPSTDRFWGSRPKYRHYQDHPYRTIVPILRISYYRDHSKLGDTIHR